MRLLRPLQPLLSAPLLLFAVAPLHLPAQQAPIAPHLLRRAPQVEVLQTGTQLVVVDVVVQDRSGHPVHSLNRKDFTLTEDKKPQTITNFEEHSRPEPGTVTAPAMPRLPPGTFTDYTPVPPGGALNILLLDALNTPMADQSYVRYQLQQFVKHADPGTRIAIFGLNTHLTMLQGFTSQPSVLKDAIEHKLTPKASNLLNDPVSGDDESDSMSDSMADLGASSEAVAGVQQFEAQTESFQLQLRLQYTLDAFNDLARYLSNFPGRKNLIWFSGSFPIDIMPDDTLADPFAVMAVNDDEFRQTSSLLTQSQVAVYPIDARGLMTNPVYNASQSGRSMGRNPSAFANKISSFNMSQANEHMTMDELANDTGGRAFYNTNGLAQAVSKALEAGSNYYTLSYTPTNRKDDGGYRNIRVTLNGPWAGQGFQLAYRHGYFSDLSGQSNQAAGITLATDTAGLAQQTAAHYAQAAMVRGAPTPSDILFKVRVLPASNATEMTLAPGNQSDPVHPIKGPFRRYDIDYAALPGSFTLVPQSNGNRSGTIEFTTFVYDANGKLLNAGGNTFELNLRPDAYADFMHHAITMHLEVSAPVKPVSFLRIAVRDVPSNRIGVVEVPTSTVSRLAPAVYPTPPAAKPQTPSSAPTPHTSAPATPTPAPPR